MKVTPNSYYYYYYYYYLCYYYYYYYYYFCYYYYYYYYFCYYYYYYRDARGKVGSLPDRPTVVVDLITVLTPNLHWIARRLHYAYVHIVYPD